MDDKNLLSDAELEKLLRDIDVPEHDEVAKLQALNLAESRFAQNAKKISKSRQGMSGGVRPMGVIRNILIFLTGGQDMKKSYAIAGVLAIGVAGIALVSHFRQMPVFDNVAQELEPARKEEQAAAISDARSVSVQPPAPPAAPPPAAAPVPPAPPAPLAPPLPAPAAMRMDYNAAGRANLERSIMPYIAPQHPSRDRFEAFHENPVKSVAQEPVSTLSIDVDTASYAVLRRALNNGYLPPKDAVRVEELINYFDYDYPVPESRDEPFKPTVALYETPWNPDTVLMHIGIKGHELPADAPKPHSNLVFLLDVSGSMNSADKLPLLKQAFRMLVDTLGEDDTIAIVTYAGHAGVVLEPTKVAEKSKILNAIDGLHASGSTAGAEGIRTAYRLAEDAFDKDGVNRVILATDGDFNVGITNRDELKNYISDKRKTGIYLSILGFGQGNYNDALMQALAQNGNGNAAYIDSINEARKVLVDEASSTLYPIADDVKIQVEFNPAQVAEYRLIGYETRLLNREDFNNDKVDAGDIGAGHTVTAIYELTPVGSKARLVDDLRYAAAHEPAPVTDKASEEYAFLKMRYKLPGEGVSKLITRPVTVADMRPLDGLSDDIRFAASVAAFGQLVRGDSYIRDFSYDDVLALATSARGDDPFNYRGEFLNLVRNAKAAQKR